MDIQEKLDEIQKQREDLLSMTPAQHHSETVKELYEEVLATEKAEKMAPQDVRDAKQKYYKARYGDQYLDKQMADYAIEGRTLRADILEKHNEELKKMDQSLSYYDSALLYLKNISGVQVSLLTSIQSLLDKIKMSEVDTTNRKTFYTEQEEEHLAFWTLLCNCIILSQAGIVAWFYRDQLKTNYKLLGVLVGLISVVFLLPYVVNLIYKLPTAINVYTEWGYDPLSSKLPWLLIIGIIVYMIWLLVWYFT